ncbi:MAG: hypothetical protein QOD95_2139 [Gammaproteobacteria bacterium]|jgi:hypothetical protein|nr:hypothetical protein [Gammaproteobacteria bacterium]
MSQRHASAIAWVAREVFLEPNYPSDLGLWLIHDTLPPSDRQNRIAAPDRAMEAEFRLELNFLQLLAVLHCLVSI